MVGGSLTKKLLIDVMEKIKPILELVIRRIMEKTEVNTKGNAHFLSIDLAGEDFRGGVVLIVDNELII